MGRLPIAHLRSFISSNLRGLRLRRGLSSPPRNSRAVGQGIATLSLLLVPGLIGKASVIKVG
jgi:hypothetical protein